MPTPLERMRRTVCSTDSRNAFEASVNSRCASSKKKTSLGLSTSPASGSVSNSSATSHMRTVDQSSGLSCTAGSSMQEMTPLPSGAVRMRSAMSNIVSPKNSVPPPVSSVTRLRRSTPTVAFDTPPMPSSSSLPSSEVRNVSSARRSERSSSGSDLESA